MSDDRPHRPRADARRNRERLIEVAARAFAAADGGGDGAVSLNAIAREAGVGAATLYRHFPTREDLVEAVYDDQVARLRAGAERLLASRPPAQALRAWMRLFARWAQTKHGMVDTLGAIVASGRIEHGRMRAELVAIVDAFLRAGAAAGDLRADVDAADLAAVLAGILVVSDGPGQRRRIGRRLDLAMHGVLVG